MGFNEVYSRISPRIHRIALHYRNYCPFLDADDLYQEMCKFLWEHYKDGASKDVNDYYIARGCELHILNYLRTQKEKVRLHRLEEPVNENGDMLKDILADNSEDIPVSANRNLIIDTIMNNGFTRREKEVFALLIKGYTTREIGNELGISHVMVVKSKKNLVKRWHRKEKRLPR